MVCGLTHWGDPVVHVILSNAKDLCICIPAINTGILRGVYPEQGRRAQSDESATGRAKGLLMKSDRLTDSQLPDCKRRPRHCSSAAGFDVLREQNGLILVISFVAVCAAEVLWLP